jgi:hypothetical protein
MKKLHYFKLLVVLFLVAGLFSCERLGELYRISDTTGTRVVQGSDDTGGENPEDPCGEPVIIPLLHSSDLEYTIGQITVTNDDECLNLKFEMTVDGWEFDQIYLFAGDIDTIPLTTDPYPEFWEFPTLNIDPVSSYTHCVPMGDLDDCIQILAQVHGVNSAVGNTPLWSKGINPGWTEGPFYTDYCMDNCKDPCDDPDKDPCDDPDKDPCDDPCDGCKMGIYRTQTPGGWGAKAAGNNPGTYRDANFAGAFPDGLLVGNLGNFYIKLTSAKAIEKLLPTGGKPAVLTESVVGGKPAVLTESVVNPEGIKNVLVGHLVALTLSVGFDDYDKDFGEAEGHLKGLIIADGHGFNGMNIADILSEANILLGGGSSSYWPSKMTEILTKINEYFVDGKQSEKYKLFECK